MKDKIKKFNSFFASILFLLFIIPALLPLFHQGFFVTDDADWMIVRFSALHQTLRDGEFPPRFLGRLNHEYGYPVATFLYPGFMYFAEPIHLVGFGFVDSIKIMLGFSLVLSAIFTYLWLKKFFDTTSSFVGALFYLYTPYHLFDIYQRGSVGELLALAVIPFILWQVERRSFLWSAIGVGLLLPSHNILATLFLLFLFCYLGLNIVLAKDKRKLSVQYTGILVIGLGLSAFFWIPALFELRYTVFSETTIANWQEYFASLSLIGYSTIAVILLTFYLFITKKLLLKKHRLTILLFLVGLISLFFSTSVSSFLWEILPVQFIQFPYRLLSIFLICAAFLAASSLAVLSSKQKYVVGICLILLLAFSARPFLQPKAYVDKGDDYYATNMDTTTVHNEYMPVWVKDKPNERPGEKVQVVKGKGEITDVVVTNKQVNFSLNAKENTQVQINILYWPGWKVFVDGKETTISYTNQKGVMMLTTAKGTHTIRVVFEETPLRLVSDAISLSCFVFVIALGIKGRRKKQ